MRNITILWKAPCEECSFVAEGLDKDSANARLFEHHILTHMNPKSRNPMESKITTGQAIDVLKSEIRRSVTDAIQNFENVTGLTPQRIAISLLDVTTHEDKLTRRAVGDVVIDLGSF